jgi:hypothetical protein
MNIDDLKDAWKNDEPKGMHLPVSTAMLGKTTSAVKRIRGNMKREFIAVLVSYGALIMLMFQSSSFFNITSIFLFIILVLNCFYFFRFSVFYKSIGCYDLNMRESIRKITYELELNIEIYKTYNFCVTPLAVLVTFMLITGKVAFNYIWRVLASDTFISSGNFLFAFAVILISFIVTYVCISIHVRLQYGKYLAELKQVMDDLGREG